MNAAGTIAALDLPAGSRVDQRVPKTLLVENGAPTAADKRGIEDGIEELWWLAALKPTTTGVPEYRDDVREYLEIAVLRLLLRPGAKSARLVELVHRAVPYPVLLLTEQQGRSGLSAAHKRRSQGEAGKTVLDGDVVTADWDAAVEEEHWPAFCSALALGRQPHASIHALYQGWIGTLTALLAARLTGSCVADGNAEYAVERHDALRECARLDAEIARLRAAAARERQIPRRVELNLELKRLNEHLAAAQGKL